MLEKLFENNRDWAEQMKLHDPGFFERLALQQTPEYLWIGCADSRVPANQILGLGPGGVFVHRNVGNIVIHTDLNCLSVLQYAVDVLKVKHVIVCGHYECGGIRAALSEVRHGLIDNWLCHIRDIFQKHQALLTPLAPDERIERMCELNVAEQVLNVCQTTVMSEAWQRGQVVSVYGLIYSVQNGLLKALMPSIKGEQDLPKAYADAIEVIAQRASGLEAR
jgi:carbonic anhydrase